MAKRTPRTKQTKLKRDIEDILSMDTVDTKTKKMLTGFGAGVGTGAIILGIIGLLIWLAIPIIAFILYAKREKYCDPKDKIGLTLSGWLLGVGIAYIVPLGLVILAAILSFVPTLSAVVTFLLGLVAILAPLFWLIWFILGAIVIFRSSMDCIKKKDPMAIFALVVWCLMALSILLNLVAVFSYRRW